MEGEAIIYFENCPAKIHIEDIKEDLAENKRSTETIYNRIDGLKNLMIGSLLVFVLGILGSTIAIMWAVING